MLVSASILRSYHSPLGRIINDVILALPVVQYCRRHIPPDVRPVSVFRVPRMVRVSYVSLCTYKFCDTRKSRRPSFAACLLYF